MEESKLQVIADALAKHGGRRGLGTSGGEYSWSKNAAIVTEQGDRTDGLPNNALYSNFVKSGTYDPNSKAQMSHGDGRTIKRDFSDSPAIVDDGSTDNSAKQKAKKMTKEERKAAKKAAKLEAKKQAKLEEKRRLKKIEKLGKRQQKELNANHGGTSTEPKGRKRSRDEVEAGQDASSGKQYKKSKSKFENLNEHVGSPLSFKKPKNSEADLPVALEMVGGAPSDKKKKRTKEETMVESDHTRSIARSKTKDKKSKKAKKNK